MAFPTTIDDLTPQSDGETIFANDVNEIQTVVEALEAKVGVDSSAVTTSLDYLVKNTSSVSPGHKHATADISGQIAVAQGGTGASTLTGLVKGNGTSAMTAVTAPSGAVVGDTDSQTLTNKTLTTPTIASFANANHGHTNSAGGGQLDATSVFSTGTIPTARLGSGSASSTTYLRGDQTWASVSSSYQLIYANHSNNDVDGTTSETDMVAQQTITAGTIGTNDTLYIKAIWDIKEVASGDTKTFRIYINGSAYKTYAYSTGSLDNDVVLELRNRNSASSQLVTEEHWRGTTITTKTYDATDTIATGSNVTFKATGQTTSSIAGRGLVLRSFEVYLIKGS